MSKIKLTGESSGYVEISAGNAAGNNTLEAPTSGTRLVAHEGSQDVTLNGNLTVNGVVSYEDVTNIDSVGVMTARSGLHVTSGNVAIGHNNPLNTLHVKGPTGGVSARFTDAVNATVFVSHPSAGKSKIADSGGNYGFEFDTASVNILSGGSERLRITSDGKVRLPDNGKLTLGAGDDLQIWSDNTDQYIRGEQNQLIVRSNNLKLQSYLGENYIHCAMNNAVSLYYDNSKKFETQTSGVVIHEDTDKTIRFTGGIGEIGNVTGFQATNTAGSALVDFGMRATTLRFATGSAERLRITSDGRLLLGTTDAGGNNTANHLVVSNNAGANDQAGMTIRGGTSGRSQIFFSDGTSGQDEYRGMLRYDHSDNSMQFRTDAAERLRIHSHGQLELKVPDANPALKITPGGTNAPAVIDFNTPGTGVAKLLVQGTERLRIASDGALFVGEYSGSGRFVLHNADQSGGADTTYSKDKGLYVRNDCGPTHVDLTGVDNFTAKIHNGAYAGSGVSDPQGTITKLLLHGVTYNGYNAYGSICLDVQNANSGRGDLVFLNGGNNTSTSEHLRITSGGTVKINPAELQTTAGDKFANIRGGGILNTKRLATGHFGNTAPYNAQQLGYIGDYMHYGCNALYYLAQTSTGNSGYSSHMFSWYDSGHWGHYGKFVLMCHEVSYIGGMCHRFLSGTSVSTIFSIGQASSVSTTSTTTGSGTHSGQSVTRYDCTVSHSGTYRTVRWYLGLLHGAQLGVTGNGKSQSDCNTYANSNGSLLHLFGVSDSNLTMAPNYRTW